MSCLQNRRWLAAAGALLVLAAAPLQAHHSLIDYNLGAPIELRGTVSKVEWTNPHIHIHVDVIRSDGKHETWRVEADSPSSLQRAKLSRKVLAIGTIVSIKACPAKDGSTRAAGRELMFANGAKHSLEPQGESPNLTYIDWLRNSFPPSMRDWIPYVVIGMPVAVLLVGLFLLRSEGRKAPAGN